MCFGANLEFSSTFGVFPVYTYKVVDTFPHDRSAFIEGLVFENSFLYEGTGLHGGSTLRSVKVP